jgi:hypothetical protein
MATTLGDETRGRFETTSLPAEVTRDAVMSALTDALDGMSEGDTFLLYYSGHAFRDEAGRLYLALSGTDIRRPYTAASLDELVTVVDNSRPGRVAIILDCCFSGAIQSSFASLRRPRDMWVIAASTSGESALEKQGSQNSILTGFLLDGLRSGFADLDQSGFVSVAEAYLYASRLVTAALADTGHVQQPTIFVPTGARGELIVSVNPSSRAVDLGGITADDLPVFVAARGMAALLEQDLPYKFMVMLTKYDIEGVPVHASALQVSATYTPNMVVHADRFECDAFFPPDRLNDQIMVGKPVIEGRVKVRLSAPFKGIWMISGLGVADHDASDTTMINVLQREPRFDL